MNDIDKSAHINTRSSRDSRRKRLFRISVRQYKQNKMKCKNSKKQYRENLPTKPQRLNTIFIIPPHYIQQNLHHYHHSTGSFAFLIVLLLILHGGCICVMLQTTHTGKHTTYVRYGTELANRQTITGTNGKGKGKRGIIPHICREVGQSSDVESQSPDSSVSNIF